MIAGSTRLSTLMTGIHRHNVLEATRQRLIANEEGNLFKREDRPFTGGRGRIETLPRYVLAVLSA